MQGNDKLYFMKHHLKHSSLAIALLLFLAGCAGGDIGASNQIAAKPSDLSDRQARIEERPVRLPQTESQANVQPQDSNIAELSSSPAILRPPSQEERERAGLPSSFSFDVPDLPDPDGMNASLPNRRDPPADVQQIQITETPSDDQQANNEGVPATDIALLLPLTGAYGGFGSALEKGAELALFSLGNHEFTLSSYDTGGTIEGAREAAETALQSGSDIMIGPLLADHISVIRPLLSQTGVPLLSFSNSSRVAGEGVFVTGNLPDQQVIAVVNAAINEGRERFALIAPDNAYGRLIGESLSNVLELSQRSLIEAYYFDAQNSDFDVIARQISRYEQRRKALNNERLRLNVLMENGDQQAALRLRQLQGKDTDEAPPFDAILLAVSDPNQLLTLAAQLSFYDVDPAQVRFMGLEAFGDMRDLGKEPSLLGAIFPAPSPQAQKKFAAYYRRFYNESPPKLAGLGFDMTVIALRWLSQPQVPNARFAYLTSKNGYQGADGLFRFHADGLIERNYAIMQITSNGVRQHSAASNRFMRGIGQLDIE